MIILTLRTDKPEAEIGLYDDQKQLAYETWQAHRELSNTIHTKIKDLLARGLSSSSREVIEGIVVYAGPGSFTGLRIGLSVANALAYSLDIPIVSTQEKVWIDSGIKQLQSGKSDKIALPHYSTPAHTTKQKK